MRKTLTFSFPFPVIRLMANVKYKKVKKASGIGYMLLVLINDSKNRNERLSTILRTFGVSQDMLFIFADEISSLISNDILVLNGAAYDRTYFHEYSIKDFSLTETGSRIFKDGFIPTNEERVKPVKVFYNPLDENFLANINLLGNSNLLEKSRCYPEGFLDRVKSDFSGLDDFIIENQHSRMVDIAKEERVTGADITEQGGLAVTYEDKAELSVGETGMEISFGISGAEEFYRQYFTPDMTERELAAKFQFYKLETAKFDDGFTRFEALNDIFTPDKLKEIKARPFILQFEKEDGKMVVKYRKTLLILEDEPLNDQPGLKRLNFPGSFVTIDEQDMRAFIPADILLPEQVLGKNIRINLLVEELYPDEQKKNLIASLHNYLLQQPCSADTCSLVKEYARINEQIQVETYIRKKLDDTTDSREKAEVLRNAQAVLNGKEQKEFLKKEAAKIYAEILAGISVANLTGGTKAMKAVLDMAGISQVTMAKDIATRLASFKLSLVSIFNALKNSLFKEAEALGSANAVCFYMDEILKGNTELEKSDISDGFFALGNNLKVLKTMLGIITPSNYVISGQIDEQDFIDRFNTITKTQYPAIKNWTHYAPEQYDELEKYLAIMGSVFDSIMLKRHEQNSDPQKITPNQVRESVSKGSFVEAIALLSIKLEYILKERYALIGDNKTLGDVLNVASKKTDLPKDVLSVLQQINDWRIKTLHVTPERPKSDKKALLAAVDTVFSLNKGAKNESQR